MASQIIAVSIYLSAHPYILFSHQHGAIANYGDLTHHQIWRSNVNNRKWQDYVYIQCEYKSTKQKIKHLLREENKVKENKIS